MKIREMFNSSRPVCFETHIDGFEHSMRGSCFIIRYKNRLYAVTARHVVANCPLKDICIPYHIGSEYLFPMSDYYTPKWNDMPEGSSNEDFVIIEIPESEIEEDQFEPSSVYDLSRDAFYVSSSTDLKLIVAGFPTELNESNYEDMVLHQQRVLISANYIEPSFEFGLETFEFDTSGKLSSFDGLSGGPVFEVSNHGQQGVMGRLAGMIVMATISKTAHYIDIALITGFIDMHNARYK